MGSQCYSCSVSGLPIEMGTPVRFLLLTESPYRDEVPCDVHGQLFPRTLPIRAVYNGYRSIKDAEEGVVRDVILEAFALDLVERNEVGKGFRHPAIKNPITWPDLLHALKNERLQVKADPGFSDSQGQPEPPLRVYQALVREDVWTGLLSLFSPPARSRLRQRLETEAARAEECYRSDRERRSEIQDDETVLTLLELHVARFTGGFLRDANPYSVGPAYHLDLLARKGSVPAYLTHLWEELNTVEGILAATGRAWKHSWASGPQQGQFGLSHQVLQAFADVAKKEALAQAKTQGENQ